MTAPTDLIQVPLTRRELNTTRAALAHYREALRAEQERQGTVYLGPLETLTEVSELTDRLSRLQ